MFDLLMQIATGVPALDSLVALITAIGAIAIAVGTITAHLSQRPELKAHKAALQSVAGFLSDVGTHVTQSKADIATLAKVTYDMVPEQAQKIVNAQNVRLTELDKKLEAAQQQISKIPAALDHI